MTLNALRMLAEMHQKALAANQIFTIIGKDENFIEEVLKYITKNST
ncbi:hypothetical protein ACG2LH_01120 [Zhouia sp. PK063]